MVYVQVLKILVEDFMICKFWWRFEEYDCVIFGIEVGMDGKLFVEDFDIVSLSFGVDICQMCEFG